MASAWGSSWGSSWGNSWGSVGDAPIPPPSGGGGGGGRRDFFEREAEELRLRILRDDEEIMEVITAILPVIQLH